jgi:uncharacterized protein YxeA
VKDGLVIILVLAVLICTCLLGIFLSEKAEKLERENEFLKKETQMLKNTLADFGARIDEMSNTVDRLRQELDKQNDWNEEVQDGM